MIIVWVKDLFFGSKIETEARAHQASCCFVETPKNAVKAAEQNDSRLALIDLEASSKTVETIKNMKAAPALSNMRIIGFLSHIETNLSKKAQMAGCDVVMPRSLFAKSLPDIFHKHHQDILPTV